ncbi:MAG: ATP-grasp domain-containing protein [Gemmataceae bacterium]|nr:ATP-grasp domain-containing protein [Gemmataceae bacterium]
MRLLIYEHVTAGGLGERPAPSLLREGAAMLRAVVEDFAAVADVVVQTPASAFRDLVRKADAVLAIAPEFDGILERLQREASDADCRWLGCSAEAIRLAADKRTLGEWWLSRGVPTPRFMHGPTRDSVVVKPRFGAGSQDTQRFDNLSARVSDAFIVQEFVPGLPASIAFLCGPRDQVPMLAAEQTLTQDGCFQYLGGRIPLPSSLEQRAINLGRHALAGIPGLLGWVGVDLVLGDSAADDRAIEINPRLTTSYVGMRQLSTTNLADAWLKVANGEAVDLRWRDDLVCFDAA